MIALLSLSVGWVLILLCLDFTFWSTRMPPTTKTQLFVMATIGAFLSMMGVLFL